MRALAGFFLLLGACASVGPPAERAAGCWIARHDPVVTTMRWFADPTQPNLLNGDLLRYEPGAPLSVRYTLSTHAADNQLCRVSETPTCWRVAAGEEGSLEGGRAFIDRYRDRLRISVIDAAGETEIFEGARDGCD